jgi:hypothetical protein
MSDAVGLFCCARSREAAGKKKVLRATWTGAGFASDRGYGDGAAASPEEARTGTSLNALMAAARNHEIDCMLVWKFDRFALSRRHLLAALEERDAVGEITKRFRAGSLHCAYFQPTLGRPVSPAGGRRGINWRHRRLSRSLRRQRSITQRRSWCLHCSRQVAGAGQACLGCFAPTTVTPGGR